VFSLLLACADGSADGSDWGSSVESMRSVWDVDNNAWDLAAADGTLLSTVQFGGSVLGWDPSTGDVDEVGRDLGQPLGILVHDGTTYLSGTDNSIAGWVGIHEGGRDVTLLAEAGDGGLPMRRPADIAWLEGALIVADPVAEVVWTVQADGSSTTALQQGVEALSVEVLDGSVVVGTESGVFADGEELDSEEAYGLLDYDGRLLATGLAGVREVGGAVFAEGPGRPGSIEVLDGVIYVADQAEGDVWELP